jgi:hypothetical protein
MKNAIPNDLPSAEDVFQRLREATGSESDADLARNLEIAPTTISTWRSRDVVPYEACAKVAIEKGISLDKLIFGVTRPNDSRETRSQTLAVMIALHTAGAFKGDIKTILRNIEYQKSFLMAQVGRLIASGVYTEEEAFASIEADLQALIDEGYIGRGPSPEKIRARIEQAVEEADRAGGQKGVRTAHSGAKSKP